MGIHLEAKHVVILVLHVCVHAEEKREKRVLCLPSSSNLILLSDVFLL